ncbi:MAG: acyltransferase [bacterium]|nr:acyltransferase [bacterium]
MGLFRLLLALAVVFAHAGPVFGLPALALCGGPLAVQMFYVVSGFYMALVLHEKYVGAGSCRAFAQSRLVRLLPMYLVVLGVTLVAGLLLMACGITIRPLALWAEHGAAMSWPAIAAALGVQLGLLGQDVVLFTAVDPETSRWFLTGDFHAHELPGWRFMLVPQAWTVSLELLFYAIAPFVVRRHVLVVGGLLGCSLLLRVVLVKGWGLGHDPWSYRFFPTELALFLAGALAYRGYRLIEHLPRARALLFSPAVTWSMFAALIFAVLAYPLLPAILRSSRFGLAAMLGVVPIALPFVFHLTARWRFDRTIGELSYPVYLVHYLFVFVLGAFGVSMWSAWSGAVTAIASLLLAWLLWRFVGEPLEVGRQRFAARLRGAGVGSGVAVDVTRPRRPGRARPSRTA